MSLFNTRKYQEDIKRVIDQGYDLMLVKKSFSGSDNFGEILSEDVKIIKTFPVYHSPFPRAILNRIGWLDKETILFTLSRLGSELKDLIRYSQCRFRDLTYDITTIREYGTCGDDFLYYIIGGKR